MVKKISKGILVGISSLTIFGAAMTTMSTATFASQKVTTVTFWTPWTGTDTIPIDDMVKKFNQTHSNIQVQILNSQSDPQKYEIALASGSPPDLILSAWNDIGSWAPDGAIQSLEPYIHQSHYNLSNFIPVGLQQTQSNGIQYALPYALQIESVLLYNKKDFKSAGIKSAPVTTGQLYQDAKQLTKRSNGKITQVGFIPDYPWLDVVFWPVIYGASFYNNANGKVTPNDPRAIQAINYEAGFYKFYGGETSVNAFRSGLGKAGTPQDPLITGQLAMMAGWDYNYPTQRGNSPSDPIGVAPFPYPTGHPQLKNSGIISSDAIFIPAMAQHKSQAWTFLQWLEQPYNQMAFATDGKNYSIPSVKSAVRALKKNKKMATMYPFYDAALSPNLKTFPNSVYINQYIQDLTDETQNVLNGQESAQAAMNKVLNEVQPLANKAKK